MHEKFNQYAVAFIKSLISSQLSKRITLPSTYLKIFSAIYIQDSTRFGLPESLSKDYPGFGGRGAKAGAKIDFVYDLKTHQMCQHLVKAMTENDSVNSKNNDWITECALILRDLGYYSHQGLHEIINKKAFFISKVKPKTALFETTGERLDLTLLLKRMREFGITSMEKQIRIGSENSLIARAIISVVPDDIRKRRKQAVLSKAKSHQYTVQKQYHVWENLNVFITNIQDDSLSPDQIMMLYRLRWQVEFVFKTWKNHKSIDQYKTMKKDRIECYVYADLLLIIIQGKIFAWLNQKMIGKGIYLSLHKFSKLMIHLSCYFNAAVVRKILRISSFLSHLIPLAYTYALRKKKKNKKGFAQITQIQSLVSCNDRQKARLLSLKNSGLKKYEISTLVGWRCFILS